MPLTVCGVWIINAAGSPDESRSHYVKCPAHVVEGRQNRRVPVVIAADARQLFSESSQVLGHHTAEQRELIGCCGVDRQRLILVVLDGQMVIHESSLSAWEPPDQAPLTSRLTRRRRHAECRDLDVFLG